MWKIKWSFWSKGFIYLFIYLYICFLTSTNYKRKKKGKKTKIYYQKSHIKLLKIFFERNLGKVGYGSLIWKNIEKNFKFYKLVLFSIINFKIYAFIHKLDNYFPKWLFFLSSQWYQLTGRPFNA